MKTNPLTSEARAARPLLGSKHCLCLDVSGYVFEDGGLQVGSCLACQVTKLPPLFTISSQVIWGAPQSLHKELGGAFRNQVLIIWELC